MIRINLLGQAKQKGKRSGGGGASPVVMESGPGGSPLTKIVAVLLMAALLNAGYWFWLDRQKQSIAVKMAEAVRQNQQLSEVKARYMERQREAENYKRRVDVIDQLRAGQTGPVELLNSIGDTVNNTEAVWLSSMKNTGNTIDLEGMALSTDAVANLITNLKKSGNFKNVEIKETFQDASVKEMQAFQFTLTCEINDQKAKS
jgi:type IV pilus assembly protein PilN